MSADTYQIITDRILADLDAGKMTWEKPWAEVQQRNGQSGHVYKGVNQLVTWAAGHPDGRWYTFNQAKAAGGSVKKGERGTSVVKWLFVEDKNDSKRTIPILKTYCVFNRTQIEWSEPEPDLVVEHKVDDAAEQFFAQFETVAGDRASYNPLTDKVTMPPRPTFKTPEGYISTLAHELVHSTGPTLCRDLTGRFGSEAYAAEELVAELGAAFLLAEFGLPYTSQHAAYIGSWIRVLRNDKHAVFTAARHATQAVAHLTKKNQQQDE